MSETERELASQPWCWRQARARAPMAALALPRPGERAAVAGCGTSLYMAQAYAVLREEAVHGETDAFAASEFPDTRRYDRVVAITRSGTTTEVVRLLEALRDAGVATTAVSAVDASPAVAVASASVVLEFADERSVVQTRFATSALAMLRATLDHDVEPAAVGAEAVLAGDLPVADPAPFDHVVFLGHGWTVGIANEAALKLREAAQVHTESYPAMEYRHGPVSLAGPSSLVWIVGSPDPAVAGDVRATGATVVERPPERDPLAELVSIHRFAVALAAARGLDPDHPRNLTRSVVLS
jgi:fructoselysine-6-P-deglycase FrlB-like protein